MKKVLIVFILALFLISCSETIVETTTSVQGVVLDSITGAPIVDAWCIFNDTLNPTLIYYSDSAGGYNFVSIGSLWGILYIGKLHREHYHRYSQFVELHR